MTPLEERLETLRLAKKALHCAELCNELGRVDREDSLLGREAMYLGKLCNTIKELVQFGYMGWPTALKLLDIALTLQEENAVERRKELGL